MTMAVAPDLGGDTLVIRISGDLDMRSTYALLNLSRNVDSRFTRCLLDLRDAGRCFDSGLVMLQVFATRLEASAVSVAVLETDADLDAPQSFECFLLRSLADCAASGRKGSAPPPLVLAPGTK